MIPLGNPFIALTVYFLLTVVVLWALSWVLIRMNVGHPVSTVVLVIVGILLLVLAFSMSGIPLFR